MNTNNERRSDVNRVTLALRNLYFTRAAFSLIWVVLIASFSKTSPVFAQLLLIIYPAWDVVGTAWDIFIHRNSGTRAPKFVNAAISVAATIAIAIALQEGVPQALIVFGGWAIVTGLIQLSLALRRRRELGGQWPMIISGGQSMIGGTSFIVLAHAPTMGITSIAGYVAFGAFYYLLSALRLSKVVRTLPAVS